MDIDTCSLPVDELCDSIRKNDPSINKVYISVRNHSQVNALLKALYGNTSVTSLHLDFSVKDRKKDVSCAALLQYLRQSTTIRSVQFTCSIHPGMDWDYWGLTDSNHCLVAMAENPAMELVKFESIMGYSCNELVSLLKSKEHCLRHLSLQWTYYYSPADDELAQAIGSLQVLESVNVAFPSSDHTTVMLKNLCSHPCLRKLTVQGLNFSRDTVEAFVALS
jgi:hypothetical protein